MSYILPNLLHSPSHRASLPLHVQNMLFNYFMDTLSHDIAQAEREGKYSDTIRDLYSGENISVTLQTTKDIFVNPITEAVVRAYHLLVDRGMPWDQAFARFQSGKQSRGLTFKGGFYESKNQVPGRNATGWMMAIEREAEPGEYQIWRPNSGLSQTSITLAELKYKYSLRTEEEAEAAWNHVYTESKSWTDKGARVLDVHMISGSLIPVWDLIHDVVQVLRVSVIQMVALTFARVLSLACQEFLTGSC